MQQIALNHPYTLGFEPIAKSVRLIISTADVELACRKTALKTLRAFLINDTLSLFKGRIQLQKNNEKLIVLLKGEGVGFVSIADFEACLAI